MKRPKRICPECGQRVAVYRQVDNFGLLHTHDDKTPGKQRGRCVMSNHAIPMYPVGTWK